MAYGFESDKSKVELPDFPLSVANGGTGATSADSAWVALGGGNIGKKNALSASDLTSGTLSVVRGGTGVSSLESNAVLIGNGTGAIKAASPLPISLGGNGLTKPYTKVGTSDSEVAYMNTGFTYVGAWHIACGFVNQIQVNFKNGAAIAANATIAPFSLNLWNGLSPWCMAPAGGVQFAGHVNSSGEVTVRNITGASIAAGSTLRVEMVFMSTITPGSQ